MKIERFDLLAYGGFSNTSLDLSQGQQGLHIIYGSNEAGKSTALRALQGWLFGIDQRCNDTYLHGSKLLRIGGKLTLNNGHSLNFIRRKGHKSTLLGLDNLTKLSDTILQPFLLGLDLQTFQQLHGMDHQKLQEGGEALLSSSSSTGQALFGAAIGSTQLQKIMRQLSADAKNIFVPRGKNPSLNSLLQQLADGKRQVRIHSLKQSSWQKLIDEHAEQKEKLKSIESSMRELEQRQKLYQRLKRTRVPLKQREEILRELETLQGLAQLDAQFEQEFYQNERLADQAEEQIKKIKQEMISIKEKIETKQPQRKFLSIKDDINSLYKRLSEQQTNVRQYITARNTMQELKDICLEQLKDLGFNREDLQQIDTFASFLEYKQRLENLVKDEQRLNNEQKVYYETADSLSFEQEKLERSSQGLSVADTKSLSSLEAVLEKALQSANLEEVCLQQEELCLQWEKDCQEKFEKIDRYQGELSSLQHLILPDIGCLERYQSLFQTLKLTREDIAKEQKKVEQRHNELHKQLEGFVNSLSLPEHKELQQLRKQRDDQWEQLKEAILTKQHLYSYELQNFEKKLHESDQLADQFCKYAEQIQQRHHCQEELKQAEHKLQSLKVSQAEELQKLERETLNWSKNWPSEIQPLASPEHMRYWLEHVQQLVSDYQKLKQEKNSLAVVRQKYKNLCDELRQELQPFCIGDQSSSNLATLIIQCKNLLKIEQQRRHEAVELKKQIQNNQEQQKLLQRKQERIEEERVKLQQSWQNIQKVLQLDKTSSIEDALYYLNKLQTLYNDYKKYKEKHYELEYLESSLSDFGEKLKQCLKKLGYETPQKQREKVELVNWLHEQLCQALEQQKQCDVLQEDLKEKKQQLSVAEQQRQNAAQQTRQFCRQIESENREQIRPLLEKIKKRDSLQKKCEELQVEIMRSADGYTIAELEKELDRVSLEELENNDLELSLADSKEDYKQYYEEQLRLASELRELDKGSSKVADQQQLNKQYMSDIQQQAQKYLRLQFAKIILENQIRNYAEQHQDPLLKRASQFFQRLTLNNYSHLKDDLNDHNQPLLFAVNQSSQAVEIENMSDGTRDQLYLALRLACLERQYEDRESPPLIVDDILISFDDQRSKAALATLAEFSRSTQVLLFTHHQRILEQAREIKSNAIFFHTLQQEHVTV